MAKKKEPLTYKAGWNGKAYKGDNWIVANSLIASRPLTKAEQAKQIKQFVELGKSKAKNVKVTKKADGTTTIIWTPK